MNDRIRTARSCFKMTKYSFHASMMSFLIFVRCGTSASLRSSLRKRRRRRNSLHSTTFNDWSSATMKLTRCVWCWGRENDGMSARFFGAVSSGMVQLVERGRRLLSLPSFFAISFSSSKVYPKRSASSTLDNWIRHCLFGFDAISRYSTRCHFVI